MENPLIGRLRRTYALRTASGGFCAVVFMLAGCGDQDEQPVPGPGDIESITAAVSEIVFQCRSVERGFLTRVDEAVLRRQVDALVEGAEEFDPDAPFRPPEPAIVAETTLRDHTQLAITRLEEGCSPAEAARLRDAIGD